MIKKIIILLTHSAFVNSTYIANGDSNSAPAQGIEDTLFSALKDLFWKISGQKKRTGVVAPSHFITKLKKENGIY